MYDHGNLCVGAESKCVNLAVFEGSRTQKVLSVHYYFLSQEVGMCPSPFTGRGKNKLHANLCMEIKKIQTVSPK